MAIDLRRDFPIDLGSGVRAVIGERDGHPAWVGLAVQDLAGGGRSLAIEGGGLHALLYWKLVREAPLTLEGPHIVLPDGRRGEVLGGVWIDRSL